ncbi:MAG: peptidoglycan-binding protein [Actinobacteria bacterium]|nr:peptidoglycan-binding protein [Actinomycetota bacterium]
MRGMLNASAGRPHQLKTPAVDITLMVFAVFFASWLLGPGVAKAALYPSGCVWNGYAPYKFPSTHENSHWEDFCYLGVNGSSFDNAADYVVGVQRELRYLGYYPGPLNDGLFGSQTEAAVEDFQNDTSLSPDGVVGYFTWFNLMAYMPYGYSSSGYDYHRVYGTFGTYYWRHNQSTDRWGIRNKDNAWWVGFTTNGPS